MQVACIATRGHGEFPSCAAAEGHHVLRYMAMKQQGFLSMTMIHIRTKGSANILGPGCRLGPWRYSKTPQSWLHRLLATALGGAALAPHMPCHCVCDTEMPSSLPLPHVTSRRTSSKILRAGADVLLSTLESQGSTRKLNLGQRLVSQPWGHESKN